MYKAIMEIGGYKPGETVPDAKAEAWLTAYDVPPVEKVGEGKASEKPKEEPKEKEEKASGSNVMNDDYLDRNTNVVKKNIEKDDLDKSTLEDLLKMEKSDKKRKVVIKAIEDKIEEGE